MPLRSTFVRLAAFAGIGVIAATMLLLVEFQNRLGSTVDQNDLPPTAVVFTGQFDRVYFGLDLLEAGRVKQLFISGVNRGAGISIKNFSTQFRLTPALRKALGDGRISLAGAANTTMENAVESACWIARQDNIERATLITSDYHLPRASLIVERLGLDMVWERLGVKDGVTDSNRNTLYSEFRKFVTAWLITLLPQKYWLSETFPAC